MPHRLILHSLSAYALLTTAALGQSVGTWKQNPATGRLYAVGLATTSWHAGEALANFYGGHLATIRSPAEQAWIESAFANELGNWGLWIGFNDIAIEGQWVWSSGEPTTYTNWAPPNPNNGSTQPEDAAHLFGSLGGSQQWQWNDETASFSTILRPLIELASGLIAQHQPFGAGCPSASGTTPSLAGAPGGEPRLGHSATLICSGLPNNNIAIPAFVYGLSNAVDPGPPAYSLPLDLSFLGWPGCSQLVSDDVYFLTITNNGTSNHSMSIPSNTNLLGMTYHAQVFVFYTPTGVAVTNGITSTVGF